jgi:hypothetical protein
LAAAGVASADKRTTADTKIILILIFSREQCVDPPRTSAFTPPFKMSRLKDVRRIRHDNTDLLQKVPAAAVML